MGMVEASPPRGLSRTVSSALTQLPTNRVDQRSSTLRRLIPEVPRYCVQVPKSMYNLSSLKILPTRGDVPKTLLPL